MRQETGGVGSQVSHERTARACSQVSAIVRSLLVALETPLCVGIVAPLHEKELFPPPENTFFFSCSI